MKKLLVPLVILLLFLGFANQSSASAAPAPTILDYCVNGASLSTYDGTYTFSGYTSEGPYYQMSGTTKVIRKHAIFGNWIIDIDFFSDGIHSSADTGSFPSTGLYDSGLGSYANAPYPTVTEGACSETPSNPTKDFGLTAGGTKDAWAGNAGMFVPGSVVNGTLQLSTPSTLPPLSGYTILKAYDVKILDEDSNEMDKFYGLLYIYFNLTGQQVEQLKAGDLIIKRYVDGKGWTGLTTFFAAFEDTGRAATWVNQPGIYALVEK